jgi:transglutaminase-like putative cysteine protease
MVSIGECLSFRPSPWTFLWARERLVRPEEVRPITSAIVARWGMSRLAFADEVAGWMARMFQAGRLEYIPDPPGPNDLWCSPSSVLERGGDDCDGLAVLAASILRGAGAPAMVRVGMLGSEGHAWVEGFDERGFFLLEATPHGGVFRFRPPAYRPYGRVEIA